MRFKNFALLSFLLLLASGLYAQKYNLLVGGSANASRPEGLYVYELNSQTGELVLKKKAEGGTSYLAISPGGKFIYAIGPNSTISSYAYNSKTGDFSFLNKQSSGGSGPAYVSIDATGKYVFAANYGGGSISAIPVNADGTLGSEIQTIQHEGTSVNPKRQTKPYVHSAVVSPDNQYVFAQDLGTDKVYIYNFDPKKSQPLSPAKTPFVKLIPGSGPRHLTFHPSKKFAYLVTEMGGFLYSFNYKNGELTPVDTQSLKTPFTGKAPEIDDHGADVHVSPDGKFLYASNRGDANEVLIYSIDQKTGKPTLIGRQPELGTAARTFDIDPDGKFLVVANGGSNSVSVFRRDQKTGLLTPTGQMLEISNPGIVKFVKAD